MIFGLGHYLHAAILRSIFRTMIFCPMDRINCRCKSPFTTFDEKRSILAAEAIKLIRRLRCTGKPAAMSSSINVVGDRESRWVGSKISRSNGRKGGGDLRKEKEEGILTEGRIEGWTDGWMRFDSAGWIFVWFHRRRGPRCQTTKGFFEQILLVALAVFSPSPVAPLDIPPVFGKGQIANCASVWERGMKGSPE